MEEIIQKLTYDDLDHEQKELVDIIGLEAYRKLLQNYAGCSIYIPKTDALERRIRNEKICLEYQKTRSTKALSVKYGLTENQIRNIISDIYKELKNAPVKGQITIFDMEI